LFSGGGGYWGYSRGYYGGGHGLIWLVLIIVVFVLFGDGHPGTI
jgi:hypothetical protein